jgi:hypothetical protein
MVCVNSAGYAVPAADVAGNQFVGVAVSEANNVAGANGAINVTVHRTGVHNFAASGLAATNVGDTAYVSDDNTIAVSDPGNTVICGKIVGVDSATSCWVMIESALIVGASLAASAVTLSDAGDHFATDTVEAAIQALAKNFVVTIPTFTGWTRDGTDKTVVMPALEFPNPVKLIRAYAVLGTAPGAGKTVLIKVNTATVITIADTNTAGESEALSTTIAANTDIVITVNETSAGAGANCILMLVFQLDDGV